MGGDSLYTNPPTALHPRVRKRETACARERLAPFRTPTTYPYRVGGDALCTAAGELLDVLPAVVNQLPDVPVSGLAVVEIQ